jgi:cell wall assembly regulator SMI1
METLKMVDPCILESFERYETEFYHTLMDNIHESYYLIDGFDYEGVMDEISQMFYVDLTEYYFNAKRAC